MTLDKAIQPAAEPAARPGRVMRLLDWLSHHHQAAVTGVICLIVGGGFGWLAGSWASCVDQGCETRPDQIEAAGTWAAVVATIGGVLIAVAAFRGEQHDRAHARTEAETERDRQRKKADDEAAARYSRDLAEVGRILITTGMTVQSGTILTGFTHTVTNRTHDYPIFDLETTLERVGRFENVAELARNARQTASISTENRSHPDLPKEMTPTEVKQFLADVVADTTIEFTLNDRRWRRIGTEAPELIKGEYKPVYP